MKYKTPPLFMRNGVEVFKLIAPSIKGLFLENALLHDMSIGWGDIKVKGYVIRVFGLRRYGPESSC